MGLCQVDSSLPGPRWPVVSSLVGNSKQWLPSIRVTVLDAGRQLRLGADEIPLCSSHHSSSASLIGLASGPW